MQGGNTPQTLTGEYLPSNEVGGIFQGPGKFPLLATDLGYLFTFALYRKLAQHKKTHTLTEGTRYMLTIAVSNHVTSRPENSLDIAHMCHVVYSRKKVSQSVTREAK